MAGKIAVIILAAGKGTRLYPLTEHVPKCLVPVAGTPLLGHFLDSLESVQKKHGISIAVFPVIGFLAGKIRDFIAARRKALDIRIVENTDYATTNNLYSLRLATDEIGKDAFDRILWANGDCIYDTEIIEAALKGGPNAILCDSHYPYNDESMKIATDGNRVLGIAKTIPQDAKNFVSIDCYSFQPPSWAQFDRFVRTYCVGPRMNMWAEIALHDFIQQENAKPAGGALIVPRDIQGRRWMEIDNAKDLAMAESLWQGGK